MSIPDKNFRVITGLIFAIAIEGLVVVGYLIYKWLS